MAAQRYQISLKSVEKYFTSECSERVQYFSTREEKVLVSKQPCNVKHH